MICFFDKHILTLRASTIFNKRNIIHIFHFCVYHLFMRFYNVHSTPAHSARFGKQTHLQLLDPYNTVPRKPFYRSLLILFTCMIFIGCGEDSLYSKSDTSQITQNIYVVPEFFSGNLLTNYSAARVQTIDLGQTIKFWASFYINDEQISNDQITNYPFNIEWTLNDESYNIHYFIKTFNETGSFDAILTTTDLFKDTLRDTVTIQVNQPINIKAIYPADGYNLLDVTDSAGITLHWEFSGQDPWEKVSCLFYASRIKDLTWNNLIDTVKCDEPLTLLGPFEQENSISYSDTSIAFYWGIKIITDKGTYPSQRDSTGINSFRTRLKDNSLSIIEVPIKYLQIGQNTSPYTRVDLISASGDTIQSKFTLLTQDTFYFKNIPQQNGLFIKATNILLPEYITQSISMDIISGSYNVIPTILFTDSIAPERAPLLQTLSPEDSIVFKIKDLGSGVNPKSIRVILNHDTLKHVFSDSVLKFAAPNLFQCQEPCILNVEVTDFASNFSSLIHWTLSSKKDSLVLEGPFPLRELQ
jgi:hypothetical protein